MDEAQDVGEGHSAVGQFAARLDARHRWAVTGTPIGPHGLADIAGLLQTIAHPLAQHLPSIGESLCLCAFVPLCIRAFMPLCIRELLCLPDIVVQQEGRLPHAWRP